MIYVCSDIHGHYAYFLKLLEKIGFSDSDIMFVIGDVIDRGPASIPLLMDIMGRKNIQLLIGNHEHMMLRAIRFNDDSSYVDWMYNAGDSTEDQFLALQAGERRDLMDWLYEQPLLIPDLTVGEKHWYLAHACHALYPEHSALRYCDAGIENIENIVWSREYKNPNSDALRYKYSWLYKHYPKDTTLVIGHTPVRGCSYGRVNGLRQGRISRTQNGHLINIDCGSASGAPLGCLCLDNGKEYYASARGEERRRS